MAEREYLKSQTSYVYDWRGMASPISVQTVSAHTANKTVGELYEALRDLENANEALCAKRSTDTYSAMVDKDKCWNELLALDEARAKARTLIEQFSPQTPDNVSSS